MECDLLLALGMGGAAQLARAPRMQHLLRVGRVLY